MPWPHNSMGHGTTIFDVHFFSVIHVTVVDNMLALVMEFADLGDLWHFIVKNRPNENPQSALQQQARGLSAIEFIRISKMVAYFYFVYIRIIFRMNENLLKN